MKRTGFGSRSSRGWMLIDLAAGMIVLVTAFWAVAMFAVRERGLVDGLRRSAAINALLVEQVERLRAQPFSTLTVKADQPVPLGDLSDRRLRGVTCRVDIEPYRPGTPDLLRITVRAIWQPPLQPDGTPAVRSRTALIARRHYEEGR